MIGNAPKCNCTTKIGYYSTVLLVELYNNTVVVSGPVLYNVTVF